MLSRWSPSKQLEGSPTVKNRRPWSISDAEHKGNKQHLKKMLPIYFSGIIDWVQSLNFTDVKTETQRD